MSCALPILRVTLLKIDQYLTAQESLASGYASLLRQNKGPAPVVVL